MLTERVRRLNEEMDTLANLKKAATEADRFEVRLKQLEKPLTEIEILDKVHQGLCMRNAKVELNTENITPLRLNLEKLAADFKDDPKNILKPDQELKFQFWDPLARFPENYRASLLDSWQSYIHERSPKIAEDILNVLGNVPAFQEQVRTIRALLSKLTALRSSLPAAPETFDQADALTSKLRKAWTNLQGDGIPKEVLDFIKKAANEGATWMDLSEIILSWLRNRNLVGMLKITLR